MLHRPPIAIQKWKIKIFKKRNPFQSALDRCNVFGASCHRNMPKSRELMTALAPSAGKRLPQQRSARVHQYPVGTCPCAALLAHPISAEIKGAAMALINDDFG